MHKWSTRGLTCPSIFYLSTRKIETSSIEDTHHRYFILSATNSYLRICLEKSKNWRVRIPSNFPSKTKKRESADLNITPRLTAPTCIYIYIYVRIRINCRILHRQALRDMHKECNNARLLGCWSSGKGRGASRLSDGWTSERMEERMRRMRVRGRNSRLLHVFQRTTRKAGERRAVESRAARWRG